MSTNKIGRRNFLKNTAIAGGGLVIGFVIPGIADAKQIADSTTRFVPNAFLRIGSDDSITVIIARTEVGQGISTTLAMLIAEELDVRPATIKMIQAPAAKEYVNIFFGFQSTGGSTGAQAEIDRYQKAGAAARSMLIQAASNRYGVNAEECRTEDGNVIIGQNRISYGKLVDDAAKLPVPAAEAVKVKDPGKWKFIGKNYRSIDTLEKINGIAKYGMDIQFPGMLTAVVDRGPVLGATVKSFDATKAKAVPGVIDVVQIPTGIAVLADNFWTAKLGRNALEIQWERGPNANRDSKLLLEEYRKFAATDVQTITKAGNIDEAFSKADKIIEVEYDLPFLAQTPMEPLTCVVKLSPDKCEVWTGTHNPEFDQLAASKITGLKLEQVFINTVYSGGSFGRRNTNDSHYVKEAVELAKASSNKLIKVVWTREDDVKGGTYRPVFLHTAKVGLDKNGIPIAIKYTLVGESVVIGWQYEKMIMTGFGFDFTVVSGIVDSPYLKVIPNHHLGYHLTKNTNSVGSWRSVGSSHTVFGIESLIDEMAHAAGKDPVAYRRELLKGFPRHLAVLEKAAKEARWGEPLPAGRARGVAVCEAHGSYVAQVAEISVSPDGKLKVHKVVCAIDCGLVLNPQAVRAQVEGGIVFGLTATLYGEITFKEGKVMQNNFHDYRMVRMNEMPVIETHLVPGDKMGGAGEAAVPHIMAAITNAIYAATGKRIRKLPVFAGDWKKSTINL
jgi:isoquinoline 1-oxidoreductase beta subunit